MFELGSSASLWYLHSSLASPSCCFRRESMVVRRGKMYLYGEGIWGFRSSHWSKEYQRKQLAALISVETRCYDTVLLGGCSYFLGPLPFAPVGMVICLVPDLQSKLFSNSIQHNVRLYVQNHTKPLYEWGDHSQGIKSGLALSRNPAQEVCFFAIKTNNSQDIFSSTHAHV